MGIEMFKDERREMLMQEDEGEREGRRKKESQCVDERNEKKRGRRREVKERWVLKKGRERK